MAGLFSADYHRKKHEKKSRSRPSERKPVPPVEGNFTALDPSDSERSRLRAMQLGKRTADRDPDLAGFERRRYELQDGTVNYSEPHMLPPRQNERKPRVLTDDPDLQDEDATSERIAAGNDLDRTLRSVDAQLTTLFDMVRRFKDSVTLLAGQIDPGNDEATHAAEQLGWITSDAVEPWLREADRQFGEVVDSTPETVSDADSQLV